MPVITIPNNTEISVKSGKAPDFSEPVIYIVKAEDGTTREYTVIVKRAPSSEKLITAFSFPALNPIVEAEVGQKQKTVELTVPYGTERTKLIAAFNISPEAVVKVGEEVQISGVTENDFSNPVKYTVTAQDGSTRNYTVIVTVAPSSEKLMKEFGFAAPKAAGIIDEAAKSISIRVPYGTDVTKLAAVFVGSDNSIVKVNDDVQKSGETIRDFTNPVIYTIVAQDGSAQDYTVTVTAAAENEKYMAEFAFEGLNPAAKGIIDQHNRTIKISIPAEIDVSNLVASFSYIGKSVHVGEVQQYSGTTANDFRQEVVYRVTAHDDSIVEYKVLVNKEEGGA